MKKVIDILPAHSKLGASSADRWMACPGSVRVCAGVPNHDTEFSREGTRAHALAEAYLNHRELDKKDKVWNDKQGIVPKEMREAVLDYVRVIDDDFELDAKLVVEKKFHLNKIHAALFGTSDAVIWRPRNRTLSVYDFKYGAGVAVDVENNTQLKYYGLGALLESGYPAKWVELIIVQPRAFHPQGPVRRWTMPASDMLDFVDELLAAAAATEAPDAPLVPGDHCGWCPGAAICPALLGAAKEQPKKEYKAGQVYDPAELAASLDWIPILKGWVSSVEEFAFNEACAGKGPTGYKLVDKMPRRKWLDQEAAINKLCELFGFKADALYFPPEAVSPAQAEKLLSKDQKKQFIEMNAADSPDRLYSKESSGVKLVPNSHKGEAVKRDAASDFTVFKQEEN